MARSKPLTTGQAAECCQVSQATIINWIKKGTLKAYTTPGGHHRILMSDFLSFLETYGIPLDPMLEEAPRARVLVVGGGPDVEGLARALRQDGEFDVTLATNECEASAQVVRFGPDAVVLGLTTNASLNWSALCQWLRASSKREAACIVGTGGPENEDAARAAGVDAYVPSDGSATAVKDALETMLAVRRE
jgi:two-component system response regulator VicR